MSIVNKFKKFAAHYATEIGTVANAVSMLLTHLPVPRAEKAEIEDAIASLTNVGEKIEAGLASLKDVAINLTAADKKALAKDVAALLKPELEALIAKEATEAAVDATVKALATLSEPPADDGTDKTTA